ncbi:ATP-dependent DNA helicase PIF1 [Sarotherodon galilaeus]
METSAGFWLLAVLLLAATSFSQAQTVQRYFKVGGTLQLSPQPVSAQITSIVWKCDKNLLAEWVQGLISLTYYSKFKGRTTLNTDTGVLEIRGLTAADSGVYSVEINNQVQSQVYKTVEIEDVPQPEVKVTPLVCNSTSESCKLVCEGDVNKAGPVKYFWKKDDGEWEESQINTMEIINDEETQRVKTFSCRMKNLVSERDSEPIDNPLYQEKTPGCGLCVTHLGAVMRSLAVLAPCWVAVCLWTKRKTLCKCRNTHS